MLFTIEIPEQDLLDFGQQTIEQELQAALERLRSRNRFRTQESNLVTQATQAKRRPSPRLADTVILGDLMESVLTEGEWDASFERTCRQIEGDITDAK